VAKADFFPRISLTGAAGVASPDLGSLIEGDSRVWSFGPGIHLPIFEGGRNRANLAAAEARYEEAVARYRGTVLNAFRQVEDALSDLSNLSAENDAANRALLAARDTAALATERYQRGLSSYLDVVDAERVVLQAERLTTQLRTERILSTIMLAEALGGGWNNTITVALR
jgi:multidrug efflux system outer membrane protein